MGENVDGLHEGDRVVGLTRFGAYASHINVAPKYLRPFPNNWSFAEAAAYPVQVVLSIPKADVFYSDTFLSAFNSHRICNTQLVCFAS